MEEVDNLCPDVDRTQFWVVGCVNNYCFVKNFMFDESECDGNLVAKMKDMEDG